MKKVYLAFCTSGSVKYHNAWLDAKSSVSNVDSMISLLSIAEECSLWSAAQSLRGIGRFMREKLSQDDTFDSPFLADKKEKSDYIKELIDSDIPEDDIIDELNSAFSNIYITWIKSGEEV